MKKYQVTIEVLTKYTLDDVEADNEEVAKEIGLQNFKAGVESMVYKKVTDTWPKLTCEQINVWWSSKDD